MRGRPAVASLGRTPAPGRRGLDRLEYPPHCPGVEAVALELRLRAAGLDDSPSEGCDLLEVRLGPRLASLTRPSGLVPRGAARGRGASPFERLLPGPGPEAGGGDGAQRARRAAGPTSPRVAVGGHSAADLDPRPRGISGGPRQVRKPLPHGPQPEDRLGPCLLATIQKVRELRPRGPPGSPRVPQGPAERLPLPERELSSIDLAGAEIDPAQNLRRGLSPFDPDQSVRLPT